MENRYFFHGTQSAVHLSGQPYLEPALATGLDEGDPAVPHVFVTPNELQATIFAVKTRSLCLVGVHPGFSFAIFTSRPMLRTTGFVYRFDQNDYPEFVQTTARGRATGNWVSFQRLDTRSRLYRTLEGVEALMAHYKVQIYYVRQPGSAATILKKLTDAAYKSERAQLIVLRGFVRSRDLEHLNDLTDINPIRLL